MSALNGNKPIWIRDSEHGFLLGKISDIGSDTLTVQLVDTRKVDYDRSVQQYHTECSYIFRPLLCHMIRYFKQKNTIKMSTITVR